MYCLPVAVSLLLHATRVLAIPQPQAPPPVPSGLPPGPIVNVTAQTPINGTVSIMTSLIIGDKSGCNDDQKKAIQQAYLDALNIVGTVGGYGGAGSLYASSPVPPFDYFGPYLKHTQDEMSRIMRN